MIYLDNASTTQVDKSLKPIIEKYNFKAFFNPSSVYRPSIEVARDMDNARDIIAKSLNVMPNTIFFTSGATESNNIAIWGKVNNNDRAEYIFSSGEHPSIYNIGKSLEQQNKTVHFCSINNDGAINEKELYGLINENTALISFMWVNNETGAINDVENIVKKIRHINKNVFIHIDGVQAFMKYNIDLKKCDIDSFSFSGHKIGAPKGIGGLYLKSPQKQRPLMLGGGQENNMRSGTENISGIMCLAHRVQNLKNNIVSNYEKSKVLKQTMLNYFNKHLTNFIVNGNGNGSPYILNISVKGIKAEIMLHILNDMEIYVSAGSACSSKKKISRVLQNMGVTKDYLEGSLRISYGFNTTIDEVELASRTIVEQINILREKMN